MVDYKNNPKTNQVPEFWLYAAVILGIALIIAIAVSSGLKFNLDKKIEQLSASQPEHYICAAPTKNNQPCTHLIHENVLHFGE